MPLNKLIPIFLMGFYSGLPFALTAGTLQAWMTSVGVNLKTIGVFALVALPYSFKPLWSPLLDRYTLPWLGRRRGWIAFLQLALAVAVFCMGMGSPAESPAWMALLAVIVAFLSASQDIVIDAYKTELVSAEERGTAASLSILGYRLGWLVSGGLALILSDHISWRWVYASMAAIMAVGAIFTAFSPEAANAPVAPKNLKEAIVEPFLEFFKRSRALETVLFVLLYKLGDSMLVALRTAFLLQTGFSRTDVGAIDKGFGLIATFAGVAIAGVIMSRLSLRKSLLTFGILQGAAHLGFIAIAYAGPQYPLLITGITLENLCAAMGQTAYAAFLMSLCDRRFTATQYALLSALMAITRTLANAPAGYLVELWGWANYFWVSIVLCVPALLLLSRFNKWQLPDSNARLIALGGSDPKATAAPRRRT